MIPVLKRLNLSDLPGAPSWVQTLLITLNNFMQNTYALFTKQITFQDNIKCDIKELTLLAPIAEFVIPTQLPKPIGVLLLSVAGNGITAPPALQWTLLQGAIRIESISGLTSGNEYKVRILII